MNQLIDNLASNSALGGVAIAVGGAIGGLWIAAAWWTYSDISRRTTVEIARLAAVGWVLVSSPLLLPFSLGVYLLARPQQTDAERRAQRLFEALAPSLDDGRCHGCGTMVDGAWRRCPMCATWLASACPRCDEWSATDLDTCPWCAEDKVPASLPGRGRAGSRRGAAAPRRPLPLQPDLQPALEPAFTSALVPEPSARIAQPVFSAGLGDETEAWIPAPAAGESRPAAAFSAHRMGPVARAGGAPSRSENRGARGPRRVRDADRAAGSGRLGVG